MPRWVKILLEALPTLLGLIRPRNREARVDREAVSRNRARVDDAIESLPDGYSESGVEAYDRED